MNEPLPLILLSEEFEKMPGIGKRSAKRLADYIVSVPDNAVNTFAEAMFSARRSMCLCKVCQNWCEKTEELSDYENYGLTGETLCSICSDSGRDKTVICVVERPRDVSAFERTETYGGIYHVLHGLISPLDGVSADEIKIKELLMRIRETEVTEVILGLSGSAGGEATAMYLAGVLAPLIPKITRIAFGLSVGGTLESSDDFTLSKALENRVVFV
ncbi:MAG: recombination mediator RecR [Ruminococcus sp.]|jgi:recombination protein RecR|nr:recombination mediator RecR [Ruminococcus sp.]